jgi:RHS repeat-associated protein
VAQALIGRTNNGAVSSFSVDNKNELTNAPGPASAQTYDANGNLVSSQNGHVGYVYNGENQLISWYNCQTNLDHLSGYDTRTDFYYDGRMRLRIRVEYSTTCVTGGGGGGDSAQRVQPEPDTQQEPPPDPYTCSYIWTNRSITLYIYDGNRVIQERVASGTLAQIAEGAITTPTVSYTRGNDLSGSLEGTGGIGGLLARSSGYYYGTWTYHAYYHADNVGNITCMLDGDQTIVASYRYDPFGNTISQSGALADDNTHRFSSKEFMGTSGLYYFLYRFYDSGMQRWINRDPTAERGGLNLFEFASNRPVSALDPFGDDGTNLPFQLTLPTPGPQPGSSPGSNIWFGGWMDRGVNSWGVAPPFGVCWTSNFDYNRPVNNGYPWLVLPAGTNRPSGPGPTNGPPVLPPPTNRPAGPTNNPAGPTNPPIIPTNGVYVPITLR